MAKQKTYTAASILHDIVTNGITGSEIVARPSLATYKGERVLLGVSAHRRLSLMIPVSIDSASGDDEELTSTLSLKTLEQSDKNGELKKFITLQTSSEFDIALFGAICDEAINRIEDAEEIRELLRSIVSYWRTLLDSMVEKSFGKSKAIGLFGELVFLNILQAKCGDKALNAWVGPEGSRYDFLLENSALEIKTTTRTDSLVAEVHGVDQLDTVPGKDRWLGVAQLEWDPNGTPLHELILSTRKMFGDKAKFDKKLELVGISDVAGIDSGYVFSQKQIYLNKVDDSFPFIHAEDLEKLIDLGRLRGFGYSVNLDGLCTPLVDSQLNQVLGLDV
jgi:hypothetical protein